MTKARLASLSLVAVAVAAIVAGCASSQPATPDADAANAVAVSAPASEQPTAPPASPEPTPAPTSVATPASIPVATPTPVPTPAATPAPGTTTTSDAATTLVTLPELSKPVPGASKVAYFNVTGNTPSKIVASIVSRSAKPCHSRTQDVLACVTWKGGAERWIQTTNPYTGSCKVTSLTIDGPAATVHLPQLVSKTKVDAALLAWWKPVLNHFAWHEGQHIRIEQKYEKKLRPLLVGHRCSSARGIIRRWDRNMAAAQHTFDVSDYHWQPEWSVPYTGSQP